MDSRPRSAAVVIWCGALAAIIVSVLLAPVINGGWCADAPVGGTSECGTFQRSLIGLDTSVWLWLAALALVAVITVVWARPRRSR